MVVNKARINISFQIMRGASCRGRRAPPPEDRVMAGRPPPPGRPGSDPEGSPPRPRRGRGWRGGSPEVAGAGGTSGFYSLCRKISTQSCKEILYQYIYPAFN